MTRTLNDTARTPGPPRRLSGPVSAGAALATVAPSISACCSGVGSMAPPYPIPVAGSKRAGPIGAAGALEYISN